MNSIVRLLRQISRLLAVGSVLIWAAIDFNLRAGWRWKRPRRSEWQQTWAKSILNAFGIRFKVIGNAPQRGLIVSNHLSYIDIMVMGAATRQVFLSKSEVQGWPLIGLLTKYAGTLYIDRGKRSEVAQQEDAFKDVIDQGLEMTVFLEGTSSDGRSVLPFRSSLLQPAVKNNWPVTPAYLKYECVEGNAATDVCYWGDMTFGSHLVNMAKVKRTHATLVFGETREPGNDRKALATTLYEDVSRLKERADEPKKADRFEERSAVM